MNTEALRKFRNFLFLATAINYVLLIICWLLMPTPLYPAAMSWFCDLSRNEIDSLFIVVFGLWEVLTVVFFLIPAIALHFMYCRQGSGGIR